MLSSSIQKSIIEILERRTGLTITSFEAEPISGGSINKAYKITTNHSLPYFLKINNHTPLPDLFEKEKNGLEFLAGIKQIAIPAIISYAIVDDKQLLLMEWIPSGEFNNSFWKNFGEQLASLHHHHHLQFGFHENNYMGVFAQSNEWMNNWSKFFIENRLLPQLQIATQTERLTLKDTEAFNQVFKNIDSIFGDEKPCLLHGDLWNGNFICNEKANPVLIDPAVYFGHRSVDLAMTTLFGGFDHLFYEAYNYYFPLPPNYKEQWDIANLYPLLIHLNLFGNSYLPDIRRITKRYMHS